MDSINSYVDRYTEVKPQFELLYELVMKSPVNITSIKDKGEFAVKHVLDSIYYFMEFPEKAEKIKSIADIGSGGGFPGLALAIYFPHWEVTLIESITKKTKFLTESVGKLGLKNVTVANIRAEMYTAKKFDLVTARGVGTVKEVLKYSGHMVADGGGWLMYKGEKLANEMADVTPELRKRGLKSETFRIEKPFTRSYLYLYR